METSHLPVTPGSTTRTAPGKLLLIGEHAVVHGQRALAVPMPVVSARVSVIAAPGPLRLDTTMWQGAFAVTSEVPAPVTGLAALMLATLEALGGQASGLTATVESTVPVGAGLGSSAAVAVALVRALYAAHGVTPTPEALERLADVAERHAHGNPSGVDAAVIALGAPIVFRRGEPSRRLTPGGPIHLVVAHSGRPRDTRAAVEAVQQRLSHDPAGTRALIERIGALANAGAEAFEAGDAATLGAHLDEAQTVLTALGVSDPALDRLVGIAQVSGALGAKLTGAGRGGCIVALAADAPGQAKLTMAFAGAGAKATWSFTLRPEEAVDDE